MSLPDPGKRDVIGSLKRQRARTLEIARGLTAAQWETTALPGWRVRELMAHLVSTDEAWITGRILRMGLKPQPDGGVAVVEAFNETLVRRWADRPIEVITAGLEKWGKRLARLAAATPSGIGKRKIPTPFGRVSLIFLGSLRVYDEWVHEQDLRRAIGLPPDDDRGAVLAAAAQMLRMIEYQTMPRVPSGTNGRVRLVVEGLPAVVVDLGAKSVSEASGSAVATVAAPPAPLMMIAAGRDKWREAVDRSVVAIEGDRLAAEAFLEALLAA